MDSFNLANLKAEKANKIPKQWQLRKIANLFRFVEVCVVLVLISKISLQLPVAVKNPGDYFRDFSGFVVSPRFVFVIGNVIIITLFAQSGQFSAQGSKSNSSEPDLYQQFIQNSTRNQRIEEQNKYLEKQSIRTKDYKKTQRLDEEHNKYSEERSIKGWIIDKEQIICPQKQSLKQSIRTEDSIKNRIIDGGKIKGIEKQSIKTGDSKCLVGKDYRRCETQKLSHVNSEKLLRRSETEKIRRSEEVLGPSYAEEGMSNEEFRRTIEAFIARQQRLRRQEEYSVI